MGLTGTYELDDSTTVAVGRRRRFSPLFLVKNKT